jgi:hypothetical protein
MMFQDMHEGIAAVEAKLAEDPRIEMSWSYSPRARWGAQDHVRALLLGVEDSGTLRISWSERRTMFWTHFDISLKGPARLVLIVMRKFGQLEEAA